MNTDTKSASILGMVALMGGFGAIGPSLLNCDAREIEGTVTIPKHGEFLERFIFCLGLF